MIYSTVNTVDFTDALKAAERDVEKRIPVILDRCGSDLIGQLKALTDQRIPPARPGEPDRFAHLGGWGNVTGLLEDSYGYEVNRVGDGGFELVLRNVAPYAAALEARDGLWVLSGTEGLAVNAIESAARQVAPEWEVAPGSTVERSSIVTNEVRDPKSLASRRRRGAVRQRKRRA